MGTYVQKWGNSLGIRIPKRIAEQINLHQGTLVNLEIEDGRLIIESPRYDLETMLKNINPKNKHQQAFDDEQQGSEEW